MHSKVLDKYKYKLIGINWPSGCFSSLSMTSKAASSVDEFFLNPYCCEHNRFLEEKYSHN